MLTSKTLKWMRLFLALAIAGSFAAPAGAQNLNLNELGSLVVTPIVVGGHGTQTRAVLNPDVVIPNLGDAVTLATVTNAKSTPVLLKIDLIAGSSAWSSTSFECELTGRETTTFVFTRGGGDTAVYVECSKDGETDEDPQAFFTGFDNGIMVIAAADPVSGITLSQDVLYADAVVVDTQQGQAYSVGAISFQAGHGQNDGNKVYSFDGQEYAKFPAVLATNFLMPHPFGVNAELILFTLDGTTGSNPTPRAKLGGFAYNDDEEAIDFQHEFDCFDIVSLPTVNPNIHNLIPGLGTLSGHLELVAQPTATANDGHDDQYGDGNDTRKRPVHGWIVQNVSGNVRNTEDDRLWANGTLVPMNQPIDAQMNSIVVGGTAAWARPLGQGTAPALPFGNDLDATLDADVRN